MKKIIAVAAGAATLIAVASTSGAVAGSLITSDDIQNQSIRSVDIAPNGVGKSEVRSDSVGLSELNQKAKDFITGQASDVFGTSVEGRTFPTKNVTNIGGSFTTRATHVASFALQPGKYLLSSDGFFITTAATSGGTRMQLAIRGEDGSVWGSDLGTCFTGTISVLKDREATCNTTRTVTIDEPTNIKVMAFGYADNQGSADSGKVDVTVSVSAVKIG